MKTVIFCGGLGTRLGHITENIPKPMVEIGEKPILHHIMKYYASYSYDKFILPLGYKGRVIRDYFNNFKLYNTDCQVFGHGSPLYHTSYDMFNVTLRDTGLNTKTGGRLFAVKDLLDDTFMLTYGDGLSNIDINKLLEFHKSHGRIATVTGVHPPARFGQLTLNNDSVIGFEEKATITDSYINGGFFVFNPKIFRYYNNDSNVSLESTILPQLARDDELMCYKHDGFWACVDTPRDIEYLNELWDTTAPWKI